MDFHTNSKLKLAYRCRILNHVQYDKVTGAVDLAGKVRTVDQLKGGGGATCNGDQVNMCPPGNR